MQHVIVDDHFHMVLSYSRGLDSSRLILLLLLLLTGWSLPAGLRRCCCRVNVTLFSRVSLIRKLQLTSDLDHFHARELPCSRVKSLSTIRLAAVEEIAEFPIPLYIEIVWTHSRTRIICCTESLSGCKNVTVMDRLEPAYNGILSWYLATVRYL